METHESTAFTESLSQEALQNYWEIYTKNIPTEGVECMPEQDQDRFVETIYQGKLRFQENGMLDPTPSTTDIMAT